MILQGRLLLDPHQVPQDGWLQVDNGRITRIGQGQPPTTPEAGDDQSLICPGFIDAHIHLPQIDAIGCDSLKLLPWLEKIIYPAEIRWENRDFAMRQAVEAHRRMLAAGTMGYAGYLTSHAHSVEAAINAQNAIPLRAIVGQVLMNRNAPARLLGHEEASLGDRKAYRLELSVNPRFAICCSGDLMTRTATRTSDDTIIQTHLAESHVECETVAELFPDDPHYTNVYDRHGLLGKRTLLAHCLHLSDKEWSLIAQRKSVVVHCPTANMFLGSGLFNLDAALQSGVRLALGSDVAAGPDFAMPRVGRAMIETAKAREMNVHSGVTVPKPADVWDLITRGNADALGWPDAGRLEVGAAADLLVLRLPFEMDEDLIGRLIYTWRDAYITHRVLDGKLLDTEI